MKLRDLSTARSTGATTSADPLQPARAERDRCRRLPEPTRAGIGGDWRTRLRVTTYALYRHLEEDERRRGLLIEQHSAGGWPAGSIAAELEVFTDLIDEGRALPTAPPTLTRVTAESLGGAIFSQLYFAAAARRRPPRSSERLVPNLMYAAVLPYVGAMAAADELGIPPPPAGYSPGRGREAR
jgi:AcrR family transcriptional regulator